MKCLSLHRRYNDLGSNSLKIAGSIRIMDNNSGNDACNRSIATNKNSGIKKELLKMDQNLQNLRIKQNYMEFLFESNTVSFVATAKKIVVDWGDGTIDEYADINIDNKISHTYPDSDIRTVKIQEGEI
jgi:hypothetical protein